MRTVFLILALVSAVAVATNALAKPSQQVPVQPPPLPGPGGSVPPLPSLGPPPYVLKVGDTVQVEGGSLGCQVIRRSGRVVMECRPSGKLRGKYGTFLSERTATVARFHSSSTAQTVFTARQNGGWRACGKPSGARASRSARGCR